ncbi:MAG TPA: hypothetical protein ENN14_01265, partial [Chloroflexi bacterium]|nr:hypothetical protein [Chloroflexota bacterium]
MAWLDYVKRDPVPWLLDPSNPSARYFTLRDIFGQSGAALTRARVAILGWPPVQEIIHQGNSHNFWGRSINPYYGGPVGTFGTLYQLAQLGTPPTPLLQEACENLLSYGRIEDGRFAITDLSGTAWLCYTGMALEI